MGRIDTFMLLSSFSGTCDSSAFNQAFSMSFVKIYIYLHIDPAEFLLNLFLVYIFCCYLKVSFSNIFSNLLFWLANKNVTDLVILILYPATLLYYYRLVIFFC